MGKLLTADSIHAQPERRDVCGCVVLGWFDTVLVGDRLGDVTGICGLADVFVEILHFLTHILRLSCGASSSNLLAS